MSLISRSPAILVLPGERIKKQGANNSLLTKRKDWYWVKTVPVGDHRYGRWKEKWTMPTEKRSSARSASASPAQRMYCSGTSTAPSCIMTNFMISISGCTFPGRENPTSPTSTHTTEVASTLPVWIVEDLAGMLNDKPVLVDLRGMFDEEETEKVGFYYGRL